MMNHFIIISKLFLGYRYTKSVIYSLEFQMYNKILKMLVETFLKKQFEQFTLNSRLIALVYQLSP